MSTEAAQAHLLAEFAALDQRLAILLTHEQAAGRDRSEDPLAGLAIRPSDAAVALWRRGRPGPPLDPETATAADELVDASPLGDLWRSFELSRFEAFVTVVALSVEIDPRYRTVMAFLVDDACGQAPTVALAQRLWAGDGVPAAACRTAFEQDGRLLGAGLISLGSPAGPPAPLPFRALRAGDWLARIALGQPGLPTELRSWVTRYPAPPAHTALDPPEPAECGRQARSQSQHRPRVAQSARRGATSATPVVFTGPDERAVIEAALGEVCGAVLLAIPPPDAPPAAETLDLLIRQARADRCGLVVAASVVDAATQSATQQPALSPSHRLRVLAPAGVHIVGEPRWAPSAWPRREIPAPDARIRATRWTARLTSAGLDPDPEAVTAVAFSHRLALDDIDAAAARVIASHPPAVPELVPSVAPAKPVHPIGASALHRVANEIARPAADQLVRRVDTSVTWDDLVLPEPILTRLQDVTASIAARPTVLQEWGFGSRPGSTGLNLLFAGPSGTGKTLAAAVIAGQSGHQLLACDLAQVVDKYLGETEKRLDAVLRRAEAANAVLLFDEADALFGRRADVTDARDRYANLEVAYLLQRIETHRGITILATNLGHHLDTAFSRRLHDRIEFPQPDPALRQRIWRQMLPGSAPLADDVDLAALARAVELSGGEIRAASLAAAYLAAAEGGPIRQRHLVGAVLRELDKAGRRPDRSELPGLRLAVNG